LVSVNKHEGEIEINLKKSIAKKILQPRDHKTIFLKYSMETIGDIERDIRREIGGDLSVFEMIMRMKKYPWKISILEVAIFLAHGLESQFPSASIELAYKILDVDDFSEILRTTVSGMNLAFTGAMSDEFKAEVEQPFIEAVEPEGIVEGESGKK